MGVALTMGNEVLPVRELDDHLLIPHGLAQAQHLEQGYPLLRYNPPVGPPVGARTDQLMKRAARQVQVPDYPPRHPVDRSELPSFGVDHQDGHGSGVHQGFQVGPGLLRLAIPAGIGDGQCCLGCEHDQGFFIFDRKTSLLLEDEDGTDPQVSVVEGRRQIGHGRADWEGRAEFREALLGEVALKVRKPQRLLNPKMEVEQLPRFGEFPELTGLLGR